MTMHLMGPYFTTTNTRKRKPKKKTAKMIQAEKDHEKFLKRVGYKGNGVSGSTVVSKTNSEGSIPSSPAIPSQGKGAGWSPSMTKRKENVYTGTEIMGIATMHKSNAVPIRNKKSAEEVAKMRRG